ncbi:hypothetical protein F383_38324 [Gossypium arboreum]|uniref:Uncharacterized protein n=1 Tax=Gossypium arboreum TaxID=29729 RepID=A0A0B0MKF4_GOSAR|nr:hypothetical protein F383_38324 [Gossypium arboreum]
MPRFCGPETTFRLGSFKGCHTPVWPGRVFHTTKDMPVSQVVWIFEKEAHGRVPANVRPCHTANTHTRVASSVP